MSEQSQILHAIASAIDIIGDEFDVVTVKFERAPHEGVMFYIEVDHVPEGVFVLELRARGKDYGVRMVINSEFVADALHPVESLAFSIRKALASAETGRVVEIPDGIT